MPRAMWLGVLVVSAWSGFHVPKPQRFVSGDEAEFRCVRLAIDAETVVIRHRNKYRQPRFVVAGIATYLIAYEDISAFASENRGEVVQINSRVLRPSGKLTLAIDPLKA